MLNLKKYQKETLYKMMLENLYSLNYMWFKFEDFIREKSPRDFGTEDHYRLYEIYGRDEAKRLSRALVIPGEGLERLIEAIRYSHWAIFENMEITRLTPNSFRMRTINCTAQSAVKRWGLPYYNCTSTGLNVRRGFFQVLQPGVKVERIFAPPEPPPKNTPKTVSCEHRVSLE